MLAAEEKKITMIPPVTASEPGQAQSEPRTLRGCGVWFTEAGSIGSGPAKSLESGRIIG